MDKRLIIFGVVLIILVVLVSIVVKTNSKSDNSNDNSVTLTTSSNRQITGKYNENNLMYEFYLDKELVYQTSNLQEYKYYLNNPDEVPLVYSENY